MGHVAIGAKATSLSNTITTLSGQGQYVPAGAMCRNEPEDKMATIRQRLESDDHSVYLLATRELTALPRDEVVKMLWDIAQSHSGEVQARMMDRLNDFDPELANSLALQILDYDYSIYHADALYSLWKTRSSAGVAGASTMLLSHPDAIVRLWCATYLGTCGAREHVQVLQQALSDHGTDAEGREVCEVAEASIAAIIERDEENGREKKRERG